ncbi:MAG: METTL5 family protein [Candidatus Verstraetearchaeota archaeon]|nr:METTL5 family protein [Candidatus Verstraetearchaeota archaeon]
MQALGGSDEDESRRVRSKKELEIILEKVGHFGRPKIRYEQYRLPANVAAEVLWYIATRHGDIQGKVIADFGCGTGMLSLGAALMGAAYVIGIDIDLPPLLEARTSAREVSVSNRVDFVNAEVGRLHMEVDVVIQNPPFGVRVREADRAFLKNGIKSAPKVYSIHKGGKKAREFVSSFVKGCGGHVDEVLPLKIKLTPTYHFHKKKAHTFEADLFRIVRDQDGKYPEEGRLPR